MASVDLVMPKMGESIIEATVLKWHKQPGDTVKMDETVLEIATDKVDSEVPSTVAGTITEILFKENDVVPVGTVIARVDTVGAGAATSAPEVSAPAAVAAASPVQQAPTTSGSIQQSPTISSPSAGSKFYSPLVLNIAGKEGIGMAELEGIPGTGGEGRVTKKDILSYVANRGAGVKSQPAAVSQQQAPVQQATPVQAAPATSNAPTPQPSGTTSAGGNVEIIEMDRMRKLIADHMVRSVATSPHVTSFTECDVTNLVKWREKNKGAFEKKYGEKITYTPIFVEALVACIKRYPMVNASVEGTTIIVKKDINIGMAIIVILLLATLCYAVMYLAKQPVK